MEEASKDQHSAHVATIAAAYLGNPSTKVEKADLAEVIRQIDSALKGAPEAPPPTEPELDKPSPAAIRRSVTADALISFIDGKKYKSLKRHLATKGFTPKEYRERFGLKADYPMTAAAYSAHRSALAKQLGLGQLGVQRRLAAATTAPAKAAAPAPRPRGRPRKIVAAPTVAESAPPVAAEAKPVAPKRGRPKKVVIDTPVAKPRKAAKSEG